MNREEKARWLQDLATMENGEFKLYLTKNYREYKKENKFPQSLSDVGIAKFKILPKNYEKFAAEKNEELNCPKEYKILLKNPNLFNIITEEEFDKKIVGEIESRKTIFLVTCMRLVENLSKATDNLVVNAKSGTGKDYTTEAVFDIIPQEEKEELIRISPKVLAYTRNKAIDENATWKKIALRLEDVGNAVLNDDGFKVMASASPNKTNFSKIVNRGKITNIEIEGKPSIILTIANMNAKEETLRRFPILYLDENRNQTKEILIRQGEYAKKGLSIEYDEDVINALKYLERVRVKVPFADKLVKLFPPTNVIVRTHFPRFLDYIKTICALHQFQRKQDEEGYFIAQEEDYEIARIGLIKTTSNILMIPLSKLHKNILDVFEEQNLENKSVDEVEAIKDIEKLGISNKWLRVQLDYLVSQTFLTKGKEKRTDEAGKTIPKPVGVYSYNKMQELVIPHFKDLTQTNTITTINTNTTNNTISSNTEVNEVNEVNVRELTKHTSQKSIINVEDYENGD
jgi:hypothetical protein